MEGLYYLCSENKGADQPRGYREADLCFCFRICKKPVFSRCGSNMSSFKSSENIQKKEGEPDRSVLDNQSSSVTLNKLAMKAIKHIVILCFSKGVIQ